MRALYPDTEDAIAFLRTKGAAWDKQHQNLTMRGPLSLRMLAALDYIRKTRIVCFTKSDSGMVGATVSARSFQPEARRAA